MEKKRLSSDHLAAWRNFLTLHALAVDAIDQELVQQGCVPLQWYDVLIELYEAPERRLRMHELARKVLLSRSGLTRLVDRLEKADLLHRELDPQDRRGFYAVLNEEGVSALRRAWRVYEAAIQRHFAAHLSEKEARALAEIFIRMLDPLEGLEVG